MSEYIEFSKKDFLSIFADLGADAEEIFKDRYKEIVFKTKTSNTKISVVIYSSIDTFSEKSRGVGEDAIRVVFWNEKDNHPISKGKRIYRVTSVESIKKRITKTIAEFMKKAPEISVVDWDYVRAVLKATIKDNPKPEFAESLLENLNKMGRLTEGQLAYVIGSETPKGFPTMEARLKSKLWVYNPDFLDSDTEKDTESVSIDTEEKDMDRDMGDVEKVSYKTTVVEKNPALPIITDQNGVELISTSDYPYKFEKFNPVQSLIFPFKNEDSNMIIGANTSAGKTVCAEIIMDEVLGSGKRVIYLSPLKSLTQEKYDDWKGRFSQYGITILTGDYVLSEEKKAEIIRSQIIVMTSEMADSRTRRMESEKNYWLKEVGLVIVDESHIITTERGHAVESGIMRFSSINSDARILFLSATMPNVDELGLWLQSLNKKQTRVIFSTWRPVHLQMHYVEYNPMTDRYGRQNYYYTQEEKKRIAVEIVKSKPSEKFLIFCHDKGTGNSLVKKLKDEGIEARFHNADLDMEERLETETLFSKREGGLRILVSTSTLAWGRNLPARNVIIVGIHRGIQEVDELDIVQMAGRAGRYGIDDEGHVFLIIPEGSIESWQEVFKNPRPVTSILNNHKVMAFHVLAEIQNRVITNAHTLLKWYSRSLAYLQESTFTLEDAEGLLNDLEKMEMVINKGSYYTLTGLGKVSGWLYFDPYDVYAWYKNFDKVLQQDIKCQWCKRTKEESVGQPCSAPDGDGHLFKVPPIMDDLSLAWALTDIPSNDWGYVPRDIATEAEDLRWKLRNRDIQASDAIHVTLAGFLCLTGAEIPKGSLNPSVRAIKYDIRRICQALTLIDSQYGMWKKNELWTTLPTRIIYGISDKLLELVKLPGIGGIKAKKMYEKGITDLTDVISKTDVMKTLFQPTLVHKLQGEARKIIQKNKG